MKAAILFWAGSLLVLLSLAAGAAPATNALSSYPQAGSFGQYDLLPVESYTGPGHYALKSVPIQTIWAGLGSAVVLDDTNFIYGSSFQSNAANGAFRYVAGGGFTNGYYYTNSANAARMTFFYNSGTGVWELAIPGFYYFFRISPGALDGVPVQSPVTNAWQDMFGAAKPGATVWGTNIYPTNVWTMTGTKAVTQLSINGNGSGISNAAVAISNINSVPYPGIFISGSGLAGVDGSYGFKALAGGMTTYTNMGFGVVFDTSGLAGGGGLTGQGEVVDLTNAAGVVLFVATAAFPASNSWLTNTSFDNVAIVSGYTNVFLPGAYLAPAAGSILPLSPVLSTAWYVSPTGNDAFAVKGRADLPLQTLDGLIHVLTTNDTAIFAPGKYGQTNALSVDYALPPGVSIIGAGIGITTLGSPANFCGLIFQGTNCVIRGLTMWGVIQSGSAAPSQDLVNFIADSVDQVGQSDGIFFHFWDSPLTFRNSKFSSAYDALVLTQSARPGYTNATADAYNCVFKVAAIPSQPADGECIVLSGNRFNMYGGSLILEATNTINAALISSRNASGDATNGLYTFYNVGLNAVNTNATAYTVSNLTTCAVRFRGMLVNSNSVYSPNKAVDYGYTWMSLTNGATVKSVPGF